MKQLLFLITTFLFLTTFQLTAQRKIIEPLSDSAYKNWAFSAGYFTNTFTNPGLLLAAEKPLKVKRVTKIKLRKNKERIRYKALVLSGHVGGYHHNNNHVGLLSSLRLGFRQIRPRGLRFEYAIGLGYFHQILDGQTFEVTENNSVIEKGSSGQGAFAPTLTAGIGFDNFFNKESRISGYWRISYLVQTVYNAAFTLRTPLELGLAYRLSQ